MATKAQPKNTKKKPVRVRTKAELDLGVGNIGELQHEAESLRLARAKKLQPLRAKLQQIEDEYSPRLKEIEDEVTDIAEGLTAFVDTHRDLLDDNTLELVNGTVRLLKNPEKAELVEQDDVVAGWLLQIGLSGCVKEKVSVQKNCLKQNKDRITEIDQVGAYVQFIQDEAVEIKPAIGSPVKTVIAGD